MVRLFVLGFFVRLLLTNVSLNRFIRFFWYCVCRKMGYFTFFKKTLSFNFPRIVQHESLKKSWLLIANVASGEVMVLKPGNQSACRNLIWQTNLGMDFGFHQTSKKSNKYTQFFELDVVRHSWVCPKWCRMVIQLNPFHAAGLFLYPLKISENLWFRKRPVSWNGLISRISWGIQLAVPLANIHPLSKVQPHSPDVYHFHQF